MEKSRVKVAGSALRCPYCHDDVSTASSEWVACGACLARHHRECWRERGACSTCGAAVALGTAPATAKARIPVAVIVTLAVIAALVLIGTLIVIFAQGSAVAPFVYSTF